MNNLWSSAPQKTAEAKATATSADTKLSIKKLTNKAEFPIWFIRIKSKLRGLLQWDEENNCPKDTPLAADTIINALSDEFLEMVADGDLTAPTMLAFFNDAIHVSSISAQTTALKNPIFCCF